MIRRQTKPNNAQALRDADSVGSSGFIGKRWSTIGVSNNRFPWHPEEAAGRREGPDEELMQRLEEQRGRGRNDYPIRASWNALIAGIVYNHKDSASLLRELRRNGELRQLCGFDPLLGAAAVPSEDSFGRFLASVVAHNACIDEMFHSLVESLKAELPDLGERLAVDSKAIESFGNPVRNEEKKNAPDGRRDTDADFGTKTYRGTRKDGSLWEKTKRWFGYKLHLLVDSAYELPLAFEITEASQSDANHLLPLVEDLEAHHPDIVDEAEELSADKGSLRDGLRPPLRLAQGKLRIIGYDRFPDSVCPEEPTEAASRRASFGKRTRANPGRSSIARMSSPTTKTVVSFAIARPNVEGKTKCERWPSSVLKKTARR